MAWPIAGPSSAQDGSPATQRLQDPQQRNKPRHRQTKKRPLRQSSPSSGLLTILASIAASSVTAGCSPTPPAFLCPFLSTIQDNGHDRRDNVLDEDISSDLLPNSPTPTKHRREKRRVPVRYEKGDDGRWRRMDTFTLYGSTICFNCQEPTITASPTSLLDPMKDSTEPPDDPNKLDITLPPGWGKKNSVKDKTIIVTLPLVLAFVICFLIIGCLFWRKSRAKKYREHDIEMKALQLRRNDEDNESIVIQAARTKQKLWARATARWKANARYTARQRRGKRSVASRGSASYSSAVSLPNAINDNPSTNRNASTSSRSPSRRTSISNTTGPQYTTENAETPISISVSPPSPAPASPPAYHQPLRQLSVDNLSSAEALSRKQSFEVTAFPPHPPDSAADDTLGESVVGDSSLRYTAINSAHVATDDKALLARLGELASEPPVEPTDSVAASALEVSAPVWQDEQLEDFATISDRSRPESLGGTHHGSSSFSSSYHSSGFPLPPPAVSLKGKEADLSYYEYEYSYDDIADVEPEIGPSAPPFDEFPAPSAPPLDDSFFGEHAGPSAPPFPADEDDHAVEQHYDRSMLSDSTDDALEYVDEEELLVAAQSFGTTLTPSQDLATTASNEPQPSPPSPLNHSTSDYPRHRVSLIESAQDSVANDCIPLPRYQP